MSALASATVRTRRHIACAGGGNTLPLFALLLASPCAMAYSAQANLTFTFGGSASGASRDQAFVTTAGVVGVASISNTTMFSQLGTANATNAYNADFASASDCAPGGGVVPASAVGTSSVRKYGCRYVTYGGIPFFVATPVTDAGPVGTASGTLNVTDTTLTGVLTILTTTDEPQGATTTITGGVRVSTSPGNGLNGYNYQTADGSPFGNAWYGTTTTGTLVVNLTGTFTDTAWSITGGSVTYGDSGFACQQGGFGGPSQGTLCNPSLTGGGFQANGAHLSWGMDADGSGTGAVVAPIDVRDQSGSTTLSTLSGVLTNLTLSNGVISSGSGEFRRAAGSAGGGCLNHIRYWAEFSALTCGSLTAGNLAITGSVVPVPASVWLLGSAMGVLTWIRRKIK